MRTHKLWLTAAMALLVAGLFGREPNPNHSKPKNEVSSRAELCANSLSAIDQDINLIHGDGRLGIDAHFNLHFSTGVFDRQVGCIWGKPLDTDRRGLIFHFFLFWNDEDGCAAAAGIGVPPRPGTISSAAELR